MSKDLKNQTYHAYLQRLFNFKNICFIEPEKIYLITFHLLGIQQSLNKIP
jgi:hypothetical protein